jgi:hypothetical protein
MGCLLDLPPEIINLILCSSNSSFLVVTLWKCGSTNLNAKLAAGCTEVELIDLKWNSFESIPKMLSELRQLQSFRLKWDNVSDKGISYMLRTVERLNGTIQKLDLDISELDAKTRYSSEWKESKKLKQLQRERYLPLLNNLGILYPDLKHLRISGGPTNLHMSDIDFPLDLKSLDIGLCECDQMSLLPRSLEHLKLVHLTRFSKAQFSGLPQNLKSLTMNKVWFGKFEILRVLPRSIEVLNTPDADRSRFNPSPDVLAALPPSITYLVIDRALTRSFSDWWPKNLTTLIADLSTDLDIASLPHTLTHLEVMQLSWPTEIDVTRFPPNLKTLKSFVWERLNASSLRLLPPSVTALYWNFDVESELDVLDALPPNLKALVCTSAIPSKFRLPLQNWPSSLTSLNLNVVHGMSLETFSNIVPKLPHTMRNLTTKMQIPFSWLPRHLIQLELPESKLKLAEDADHADASQLPRTLTSLQVKQISGVWSNKSVGLLPPALQSLIVTTIDDEQLWAEQDCFQAMTSLRTLTVKVGEIPSPILRFLPPMLRSLNIRVQHLQCEQDLSHLPSTLTRAEIHCTSTDLFETNFQVTSPHFLPQYLQYVAVYSTGHSHYSHPIYNIRQ